MRAICIAIGLAGVVFGLIILSTPNKAHGAAVFMLASGTVGVISASALRRRS